jgi:predicted porin
MKMIASLLCFFCTLPLLAQNEPVSTAQPEQEMKQEIKQEISEGKKYEFAVSQGYGRDKITSKMKFGGGSHFDRRYKKLSLYQTRISGKVNFDNWFAAANAGYGDLRHGRAHYTIMNMHLHGKVKDGHNLDAAFAVGKRFSFAKRYSVSPFVGYMWEKNRLKADHFSFRSSFFRKEHKLPGIKSKDTFYWNAPFIGCGAEMNVTPAIDLYADYKFLFAVREHNNLRLKDLAKVSDHSKRSKGFGNMGTIGCGYKFCKNWALRAEYEISDLHAKGGSVKVDGHRHHAQGAKTTMISSEVRLCLDYAI